MALNLMRSPQVKMHGPEHHFLVPAVRLAAYFNVKKDHEQKVVKIKEAGARSSKVLGDSADSTEIVEPQSELASS